MSLGLLVLVVACGIALIVAAVHLAGGSKRSEMRDPGPAIVEFGRVYPDEAIRDVVLTADGSAAFLRLAGGRTGFVQSMGRHYLARLIAPGGVTVATAESDAALTVRFNETGYAGGTFSFRRPEEAAEVALWLCGTFAMAAQDAAAGPPGPDGSEGGVHA